MTHRAGATVFNVDTCCSLGGEKNELDAIPDVIPIGGRVPTRPELQSSRFRLNDGRKRLPSLRDVRGVPKLRVPSKPNDDRTSEITLAPVGLDHERCGQSPVPRPLGTLPVSGGGSLSLSLSLSLYISLSLSLSSPIASSARAISAQTQSARASASSGDGDPRRRRQLLLSSSSLLLPVFAK